MKKNRWIAALAVMVMALAVAGCSDGSSGNEFATGSSGGSGNSSGSGVDNPVSQQPDYSNCVVGDFVLKDGTILSKDETPESGTVAAVIVRTATNDKPALGVGIVHNRSGLAWCSNSAAGFTKNITALQGDKTSGYMDGSDGWEKLKAACSDAESNPANYSAWNYCRNYGANNDLIGDLSKAGGSTFGKSWYWSCCQSPSGNVGARVLGFSGGDMGYGVKYGDYSCVCSVRAFN